MFISIKQGIHCNPFTFKPHIGNESQKGFYHIKIFKKSAPKRKAGKKGRYGWSSKESKLKKQIKKYGKKMLYKYIKTFELKETNYCKKIIIIFLVMLPVFVGCSQLDSIDRTIPLLSSEWEERKIDTIDFGWSAPVVEDKNNFFYVSGNKIIKLNKETDKSTTIAEINNFDYDTLFLKKDLDNYYRIIF